MVALPTMESPEHYGVTDYPGASVPIHILVAINADIFVPIPHVVVRRVSRNHGTRRRWRGRRWLDSGWLWRRRRRGRRFMGSTTSRDYSQRDYNRKTYSFHSNNILLATPYPERFRRNLAHCALERQLQPRRFGRAAEAPWIAPSLSMTAVIFGWHSNPIWSILRANLYA